MIGQTRPRTAACLAALLSGCAVAPPHPAPPITSLPPKAEASLTGATALPPPSTAPVAATTAGAADDGHVRTTILAGGDSFPASGQTPTAPAYAPHAGPISLNFPAVDVQAFAKAVLGDILGLSYAVDPSVHGMVTLITPRPVAKSDVLALTEDALKTSGLALEPRGGIYTIVPLEQAKGQAPTVGAEQAGFGNETVTLHYANPEELKKLIDPIVPGVIMATDPATGTMVLSGASGQRRAVRELVQQFDMDWLKGMSFALYVPKNTDARLIAPELDKLINASGAPTAGLVRLVAMERLNGIVAIAPRAQYLEDVRKWVEVLDREGASNERRLYVYRVQNGRATDLANVLISAFGGTPATPNNAAQRKSGFGGGSGASSGSGGLNAGSGFGSGFGSGSGSSSPSISSLVSGSASGSGQTLPGQAPTPVSPNGKAGAGDSLVITADEANNAVVAYATLREYTLIEDALRKLDITPLQVVVEASISEVTLNDTLQYGTQWFFQTHGNQYALTQSTTSSAPIQSLPGFAYTVLNSSNGIAATINALSQVTHVEVLSAPNLLVLNNQTASLEVGEQVPISTGSAISTETSSAPIVNSVDYRDTGVIMQITPRVNSSGLVLLDISQEVSQVDNTSTASAANPIDSPVISERKISSSIAVQDGQTIALGGLISDDISKTRSGVPILSAIPILGALVGNRSNTRQRTELLVLLTPKVIRNPDDAHAITDELKQKIRSVEPIRPKFEP